MTCLLQLDMDGVVLPPLPPSAVCTCPRRGADLEDGDGGDDMDDDDDVDDDEDEDERTKVRGGGWCVRVTVVVVMGALGALLLLPLLLSPPVSAPPPPREDEGAPPPTEREALAAVDRLLIDTPLVDAHNDLPWNVRMFVRNRLLGLNLSSLAQLEPWSRSAFSHTDLARLRQGRVGAQFWSAYVPCAAQHRDAVQLTLEQIDVIKRLVRLHPSHLALATSHTDILLAHRRGLIASLIGVEGGHSLGSSLAVLRQLYELGARYLTLTHKCDTPWARCSATAEPEHGEHGEHSREQLSAFGLAVVREMNRLGMVVDLSHASEGTARQAIAASRAPVMFSHSGARALCDNPRNVPDEVLRLLPANGGVLMVTFYARLLTCNATARLVDVVRHIEHVRDVAGVRHVGLGAGYDGINGTPTGLEDVSGYPRLLASLLRRPGWTEGDVRLLAGLNVLRVLARAETVRDELREGGELPAEERLAPQATHAPCASPYS